jgi:hypothetical protein
VSGRMTAPVDAMLKRHLVATRRTGCPPCWQQRRPSQSTRLHGACRRGRCHPCHRIRKSTRSAGFEAAHRATELQRRASSSWLCLRR